ncbi:carbon monoxide dehydrogenase [Natrarchaeobius halalkaliphilus]|uniref:Carbon monoxide dehydrogenase n=1 Tax=Natrarchaeobius halalkaliphilus TaxID=1679091 RepID=A0A3N6LKA3_9EURY|nr:SRPBCC domain-containing protein [Natrarchaeobius halalkaliphilus]RQG89028.1 carbon monoxide dehydrogenase [Natrarchaeobius halalkaliphilus]
MRFDGTFELGDVSTEAVWLVLSDPVMIEQALPGCEFLLEVDDDANFDELRERAEATEEKPPTLPEATPEAVGERAFEEGETYAALMELGVGGVKPSFETTVTIAEREFPRMATTGNGSAANSSFEMSAWMELEEIDDGVAVEWEAEADVFGKIAQLGGRVINPVANRIVNQFFEDVASRLDEVEEPDDETERTRLRDRIQDAL